MVNKNPLAQQSPAGQDTGQQASGFRNWISVDGAPGPSGEGGFAAEPDRYHLYVALMCPWASRTLMSRALKGLHEIVSVTVLDPRLSDGVWRFGGGADSVPGSQPDPLHAAATLQELYARADAGYSGEISVPVLWDKKRETIVSNESAEIIRMFNSGFGDLADNRVDLYPERWRDEIERVNERLSRHFYTGVYRVGYARSQAAYDKAVREVFDSLAFIEQRLDGHDYLVGDQPTEVDVCTFVTLVRFDLAYYSLFKTNLKRAQDYPGIDAYIRRIHALPGIAATVDAEHIKIGYYSIPELNPSGIVPIGPAIPW